MNHYKLFLVGVAVSLPAELLTVCVPTYAQERQRQHVIEQVTEDIAEARVREHARVKGGPENNKLENVSSPVRAGKTAFKHWIIHDGERSELAMRRTKIGETCWYGWSLYLPADFDPAGHYTIVMQMAAYPPVPGRRFPGGGVGHHLTIGSGGGLGFTLQHQGVGTVKTAQGQEIPATEVKKFDIARADAMKGRWTDFVMHARWTGDDDGFLRFWVKVGDGSYQQKIDYKGATWFNDEGDGPYFKMGAYLGDPGWKGNSPRVVYTDEYRLGDANSSFDEVAPPGARARAEEAKNGKVRYLTYRSSLNNQDVAIMVYTPPGYDAGDARYPVVYNLHGAGGGSPARQWDRTQGTLTDAMENNRVRPMIYVFVNGLGDTFFVDSPEGLKVESSIIQELIPFIDANYRTIASREGKAVDGFSMGGFGALMLAFRHPDLFSSVVSYGAALINAERADPKPGGRWVSREHFDEYDPRSLAKRNAERIRDSLRVRVVCGEEDGLFPANVTFKALLDELKIPVSWVTVPGVAHDTKGLYRRVGLESLRFMDAAFAQEAGK
jgi:enterochelin esterase-like enzyme